MLMLTESLNVNCIFRHSPSIRIFNSIFVILAIRIFVSEIAIAFEPTSRWCLFVVKCWVRFAKQSIGRLNLFTIFTDDNRFASDWIDNIAQLVYDFLNFVCDQSGQLFFQLANKYDVTSFAHLFRIMREDEFVFWKVLYRKRAIKMGNCIWLKNKAGRSALTHSPLTNSGRAPFVWLWFSMHYVWYTVRTCRAILKHLSQPMQPFHTRFWFYLWTNARI